MELCLSIGDQAPDLFGLISAEKPSSKTTAFCMGLSIGPSASSSTSSPSRDQPQKQDHDDHQVLHVDQNDHQSSSGSGFGSGSASKQVPVQLDLLPHTPVPRSHGFPWPPSLNGCSSQTVAVEEVEQVAAAVSSSPTNSGASSFHQMEIGLYSSSNINYRGGGGSLCGYKRDHSEGEGEGERAYCRLSDEDVDINGNTCRKKLRLSKEQSAFLEETFKQHNTLNPKQKQALAKQLNLRARQVEVWFQNRRARTKLKQTEVDCEFLKRCCETLTEENRRLHKELQELRALKTCNSNPFYMQSPATTLTMCPSCERIATTNTDTATTTAAAAKMTNINIDSSTKTVQGFPLNNRPRFYPFSQPQSHQPSAAS